MGCHDLRPLPVGGRLGSEARHWGSLSPTPDREPQFPRRASDVAESDEVIMAMIVIKDFTGCVPHGQRFSFTFGESIVGEGGRLEKISFGRSPRTDR